MKKLTVQIIEKREPSTFSYGGYEVKLTCGSKTIEAVISFDNVVSTQQGVWLHGLVGSPPFTSERVKQIKSAIQNAFDSWDEKQTEVLVKI